MLHALARYCKLTTIAPNSLRQTSAFAKAECHARAYLLKVGDKRAVCRMLALPPGRSVLTLQRIRKRDVQSRSPKRGGQKRRKDEEQRDYRHAGVQHTPLQGARRGRKVPEAAQPAQQAAGGSCSGKLTCTIPDGVCGEFATGHTKTKHHDRWRGSRKEMPRRFFYRRIVSLGIEFRFCAEMTLLSKTARPFPQSAFPVSTVCASRFHSLRMRCHRLWANSSAFCSVSCFPTSSSRSPGCVTARMSRRAQRER